MHARRSGRCDNNLEKSHIGFLNVFLRLLEANSFLWELNWVLTWAPIGNRWCKLMEDISVWLWSTTCIVLPLEPLPLELLLNMGKMYLQRCGGFEYSNSVNFGWHIFQRAGLTESHFNKCKPQMAGWTTKNPHCKFQKFLSFSACFVVNRRVLLPQTEHGFPGGSFAKEHTKVYDQENSSRFIFTKELSRVWHRSSTTLISLTIKIKRVQFFHNLRPTDI